CAIRDDDSLWCWGSNENLKLGLDGPDDRLRPERVGEERWLEVSARDTHTCAIRIDHTLWCWGGNQEGQLGQGDNMPRGELVQIDPDQRWDHVSAGQGHTCAITTERTLWCWGRNGNRQLGLG